MENYQENQAPVQPQEGFALPEATKKPDIKKLAKPIIAVVVVIAVIAGIVSLFGKGYEKPFKEFAAILYEGKVSKIEKTLPDEVWEELADGFDMDKDELIEKVAEGIEDYNETVVEENGEFKKIKYDITNSEKIKGDDLDEIKEFVADAWDIDEDDVSAAYEFEVEGEIIYEDEESEIDDTFYSVKVNGKWYLFMDDVSAGQALILLAMFGNL